MWDQSHCVCSQKAEWTEVSQAVKLQGLPPATIFLQQDSAFRWTYTSCLTRRYVVKHPLNVRMPSFGTPANAVREASFHSRLWLMQRLVRAKIWRTRDCEHSLNHRRVFLFISLDSRGYHGRVGRKKESPRTRRRAVGSCGVWLSDMADAHVVSTISWGSCLSI